MWFSKRELAKIEVKCPTTQKQLKQFLGLASYYRRFVKNIATKYCPLYHLIKKGAKFVWALDCQPAFDTRAALTTPPILAFPDFINHLYSTQMLVTQELGRSYCRSMVGVKEWSPMPVNSVKS